MTLDDCMFKHVQNVHSKDFFASCYSLSAYMVNQNVLSIDV